MQTIFVTPIWSRWVFGFFCHRKGAGLPKREKLGRRKVLSFPPGESQRIRCLQGVLWVTGSEEREDMILRTGSRVLAGRNALVVEALEDSVVEITRI